MVPPSSRSSSSVAVRAALSRLEASPACDEWASSAMIAKFLPFRSAWVRISSRAKGKVWMVTMMIFVPPCRASASSCDFAPPSPAMWATTPGVRSIWRIASCN
jgi:hypothetical protein